MGNKFIKLMKNLVYMQMQIDSIFLEKLKNSGKQTYYRILANNIKFPDNDFFISDFLYMLRFVDEVVSLPHMVKLYRELELCYIEEYSSSLNGVSTFDDVLKVLNTMSENGFIETI